MTTADELPRISLPESSFVLPQDVLIFTLKPSRNRLSSLINMGVLKRMCHALIKPWTTCKRQWTVSRRWRSRMSYHWVLLLLCCWARRSIWIRHIIYIQKCCWLHHFMMIKPPLFITRRLSFEWQFPLLRVSEEVKEKEERVSRHSQGDTGRGKA